MTPQPKHVRLRAYQVGFGDCLLLTVTYGSAFPDGRDERHLLIDFGSKVQRKGGPSMAKLSAKIVEHCGSELDVVVATHRHEDHVKGFGDVKAGAHLDGLKPKVVVRPWTDVPEAQSNDPALGLEEESQAFVSVLEDVHRQAQAVNDRFQLDSSEVAERAKVLAELGIKNARAIARLEGWADEGRPEWVKADDEVDVDDILPGVTLQVLGPPTLGQVPGLKSYASASSEYWLALAAAKELDPVIEKPPPDAFERALDTVAAPDGVGAAGWLLRSLKDVGSREVLDIVEGFDNVLNNTSVVLLVTVGKRSMLLAGDAQAENWSYSLDRALGENGRPPDPALRQQLADVDLYKVGHHGSRNATPMRLFRLWAGRTTAHQPLTSVLCTKTGVYDKSVEGAVPKPKLVESLAEVGPVYNTEDLPDKVWWFDVEAPTNGNGTFAYAEGPPVK